jgi:hypothetical protein
MCSSSDKSDLAGQLAGGREALLCKAASAVVNVYCWYDRAATQGQATVVMSQVACHISATGSHERLQHQNPVQ